MESKGIQQSKKYKVTNDDIFSLLEKSKEQYEEYLNLTDFNRFSVFNGDKAYKQEIKPQKNDWDFPLKMSLYGE
ncbi:MAG: hypothetical protein K8R75_04875 [Deltaproteobacteria bacterium]|nr:hypothetical protein [Deltaproteobacteria bacterium]